MVSPLCGYAEDALDELRLPYRVAAIQSFDLSFPDHMRSLYPLYRPPGCVERAKAHAPTQN